MLNVVVDVNMNKNCLRVVGRSLVLASGLIALGLSLLAAKSEIRGNETFHSALQKVKVHPPEGTPPVTQESIELAITMYDIKIPENAFMPRLDLTLEDRGLTRRATWSDKSEVTIGPAAFTSWALLGSTIAHEVEVHCHQNFMLIFLMDGMGLDGTGEAERQAYFHELKNASRFGLAAQDARLIADTVDYFYPEDHRNVRFTSSIKGWLARNFLREKSPNNL